MWKSVITALSGLLGNGIENVVNVKQQRETNKHNEKLVKMQNDAAADQANLSYQRSRADNQVANMMNAGMSRAGAINVLNGGGHYQPAPVNSSQNQAPQIDTSSVINAIQEATKLAENRRQFDKGTSTQRAMQDKQIASTERMQKASLESNERIAQMNINASSIEGDKNRSQQYLIHREELQYKIDDLDFRKQQYEDSKALVQEQLNLTKAQRERIVAELDEFKSKPAKDAREAEYQMRALAAEYNIHINKDEMFKYIHRNFVKDDSGNYVPRVDPTLEAQGILSDFWDIVFSVIPVKMVIDVVNTIL